MSFPRRFLSVLGLTLLLGGLEMQTVSAHATAAQPGSVQPATASAPTGQASSQAYSLPPEKLGKAIALSRIGHFLYIAFPLLDIAVLWILLATGWAARFETFAQSICRQRWLQGLLCFAMLIVLITLVELPLDVFAHRIYAAYGISVENWGGWFADRAKSLGLAVLIGSPVMLLFHWIVRCWPRRYWLVCWVVAVPLILLAAFLEPLGEPIFYKYEPLAKNHPTLAAELERVVVRTGIDIPADRMFLMKASEKSNGLNAYVSGIGATKRIVVWDTTAGRIPDDEILFTFAHESGHYVLNHIPKGLALAAIGFFFIFWACARVAGWLAGRFGDRWHAEALSSRAGFVVILLTVAIASFLLEPVENAVDRHDEHEADVYGQEAIHGLVPDPQKTAVATFNALGEAWLEDPNPSPFVEFWEDSHPSAQKRANFAAHYDPWMNGGHGEFFDK